MSVFVFNVRHLVVLAFFYIHPIAVFNLTAYPGCNVFGRRIERQQFVEVAMIKISVNFILYMLKVNNHTLSVKLTRLAINRTNPVESVQITAFAVIRKSKAMTASNLHSLRNVIHNFIKKLSVNHSKKQHARNRPCLSHLPGMTHADRQLSLPIWHVSTIVNAKVVKNSERRMKRQTKNAVF